VEALSLLEKKIIHLLELISKLKEENNRLKAESAHLVEKNADLSQRVTDLTEKMSVTENAMVEHDKDLDELSQEKALTKMVVDDLIKSIDSFVDKEKQQ